MGQDQASRPALARRVARLGRRDVAAWLGRLSVLVERPQGRLAEQQVGIGREVGQAVTRSRVGGVGEPAPIGLHAEAPAGDVVLGPDGGHRDAPEGQRRRTVVLRDPEARLEVLRIAGALGEVQQLIGRSGRHEDAQPLILRTLAPWIDVAQGDEVEHVVGVHVADHDRVELVGVVATHELRDDARTDVDEQAGATALDEVAGAGLAGVGRCGGASEDRESHRFSAHPRPRVAGAGTSRCGRAIRRESPWPRRMARRRAC